MKFDKSRVYTALNADELKVGSKVIVADSLASLKDLVDCTGEDVDGAIYTLVNVEGDGFSARFDNGTSLWHLAYLVEEPKVKKLEWSDLKLGDVITNGRHLAMVTQIDKECTNNMHIYAGSWWFKDSDLEKWVKEEEK